MILTKELKGTLMAVYGSRFMSKLTPIVGSLPGKGSLMGRGKVEYLVVWTKDSLSITHMVSE